MERLLVPVFFQGEGSAAIRGANGAFFFPSVIVFGEFIVLSAEFYCSVLKKFITNKYVPKYNWS